MTMPPADRGLLDAADHDSEVRRMRMPRVANLSTGQLRELAREEMMQVIAAELPFVTSVVAERLDFYDRETLNRLAFLAQRACRNGIGARDDAREM